MSIKMKVFGVNMLILYQKKGYGWCCAPPNLKNVITDNEMKYTKEKRLNYHKFYLLQFWDVFVLVLYYCVIVY